MGPVIVKDGDFQGIRVALNQIIIQLNSLDQRIKVLENAQK